MVMLLESLPPTEKQGTVRPAQGLGCAWSCQQVAVMREPLQGASTKLLVGVVRILDGTLQDPTNNKVMSLSDSQFGSGQTVTNEGVIKLLMIEVSFESRIRTRRGPYVFAAGLSTYLLSKEIYVLEHEFYSGLSLALVLIVGIKKLGPAVAKYLDKHIDEIENSWESARNDQIKELKELIEHEKKEQQRTDGQKMIIDIKKDNINLQLEAAYRERLSYVYQEVKKRLDYQVQLQNIERTLAQKHMVQWIVENVKKSFTPDQEKAVLARCISDLQNLVQKA